jgi:transketolase
MNFSMRDAFLDALYNIARDDRRLIIISNDFGAPSLDKFREDLPGQFIHIGIAEQNMVAVAAGLAMAGKIVYMYSIAPFLPLRCFEQIRVHLSMNGLNVSGVMVGTGYSYDLSGPTHQALEDIGMMNSLPRMTIYTASDSVMGGALARMTYENPGPKYIRFDREILPALYPENADFSAGLSSLRDGRDLTIVATGIMVHRAFEVAEELARHSINAGIIDLYRIKPLNEELLFEAVGKTGRIVTIEESFISSGIGSIISGLITESKRDLRLKRIGVPDRFYSQGGDRKNLQKLCGLDTDSITGTALKWLKER